NAPQVDMMSRYSHNPATGLRGAGAGEVLGSLNINQGISQTVASSANQMYAAEKSFQNVLSNALELGFTKSDGAAFAQQVGRDVGQNWITSTTGASKIVNDFAEKYGIKGGAKEVLAGVLTAAAAGGLQIGLGKELVKGQIGVSADGRIQGTDQTYDEQTF